MHANTFVNGAGGSLISLVGVVGVHDVIIQVPYSRDHFWCIFRYCSNNEIRNELAQK